MFRQFSLKGFYEVEKTIGCGGFAKVKLATHVATGEKVAIKIMNKNLLGPDLPRVKLELSALKTLSHENICKLYEVIETDTHFFIVMEYCSGGELFDHIVEKNRLTESESRMFFRQIVAAVAYLHDFGYAHRDLKPENVLLDKYQNLKLIDFGLCAKPKGGMHSPLFTSCGSPTYAAPELVLGKVYLGTEVDVWAMGVLLYALLTGTLPFDDLNIDSLYKKILSGQYHEPSYLSQDSLSLIRSMLQIDPKKRITVKELLSHRWLTLGILDPVVSRGRDYKSYDFDCIQAMANYYQIEADILWKNLQKWNYDYYTSTYFLLLTRKKRGLSLRLNNSAHKSNHLEENYSNGITKSSTLENVSFEPKSKELIINLKNIQHSNTPRNHKRDNRNENTPVNHRLRRPNANGFVQPSGSSAIRKPLKRIRSPGPDDSSPIPVKKIATDLSTPVNTPERKLISENSETPGSARRVLGSIERSFHKVVNVLTPKKTEETTVIKPAYLTNKELCNVSTTQCNDPDFVITELMKALERKGIRCKRKGYTLRGKFEPNINELDRRLGECSFELEICYLPNIASQETQTPTKSILKKGPLNNTTSASNDKTIKTASIDGDSKNITLVGIRRKRLKGDSWCYKKVCEEVLALTSTGFKYVTESSV